MMGNIESIVDSIHVKGVIYPKIARGLMNGIAYVATYVGKVKYGNVARVSPRVNDVTLSKVQDGLEETLKQRIESHKADTVNA